MTATSHPYPDYKPSGVQWLGDVPTHWVLAPSRAVFTEINERDHPDEQMLSVTIARGVIRQKILLQDSSQKDSSRLDKSAYKLVCPGDLAYNKMRAWQGAFGVSTYRGIVSPAYVVQRPRNGANALYFHHLLRTPAFAAEAERWSYGIASDMWSLRPEHFKMMYVPLPPPPEQAAIVRYLDYVDRRIRRYVNVKRKLIALLEEEKQAIINQAVTRGLDPNAPLRPSGVEWLGDVPEHWEVPRLKNLGYLKSGAGFPHAHQGNLSAEFPFFKVGDMAVSGNERLMQVWKHTVSEDTVNILGAHVFLPNTIVFAKVGAALLLNRRRVLTRPSCVDNNMMGFLPRGHSTEWMCHWLSTVDFRMVVNPGAVPSVNEGQLEVLPVLVPPLHEQAAIIEYLDKATTDIDSAIVRARRQIDLVQEYRTRLIADVVTGKLDVREVAAHLPEEPDDQDRIEGDGQLTEGMDKDLYDADASGEELAMESEVTV